MSFLDEQQLLAALQLNLITGIGPRIQQLLCERFGSPAEVLKVPADQLQQVPGVGWKLAEVIQNRRDASAATRELARCREMGVHLYPNSSTEYPPMLAEICDAPNILYCRGSLQPQDQLASPLWVAAVALCMGNNKPNGSRKLWPQRG